MNYLYEYSTFDNTQELNHHVSQHVSSHYYDMNDTEREVLYIISRYAVNKNGSCQLKVSTIADTLEKSERTIYRILNKLYELHIIERVNTTRLKSGGQGANIYRILPYVRPEMSDRAQAEESTQASVQEDNESSESINFISNKDTLDTLISEDNIKPTQKELKEMTIEHGIRNHTSSQIVDLFAPFFYGSELYKYVGILFRAKYHPYVKIRVEDHVEDFKACIFDVIRRFKQGYVRSLEGYMHRSIEKLTKRLYIESIVNEEALTHA